mmetsp:Transcript_25884/g.38775  ORF Transcript_25884/g.38775 Transcript_25884/m.38775 type:complete len:113 (-) Transcript_25884:149-487(-)
MPVLHLRSAVGPCVVFRLASSANRQRGVHIIFIAERLVGHRLSHEWSIHIFVAAVNTTVVESDANRGLCPRKILVGVTSTAELPGLVILLASIAHRETVFGEPYFKGLVQPW